MRFSADQADEILIRAGIAALYYDDANAAVTPGAVLHDVDHVLEPVAMAVMTDEERDHLRTVTQQAIVDPTGHRREFRLAVLNAIAAPYPLR